MASVQNSFHLLVADGSALGSTGFAETKNRRKRNKSRSKQQAPTEVSSLENVEPEANVEEASSHTKVDDNAVAGITPAVHVVARVRAEVSGEGNGLVYSGDEGLEIEAAARAFCHDPSRRVQLWYDWIGRARRDPSWKQVLVGSSALEVSVLACLHPSLSAAQRPHLQALLEEFVSPQAAPVLSQLVVQLGHGVGGGLLPGAEVALTSALAAFKSGEAGSTHRLLSARWRDPRVQERLQEVRDRGAGKEDDKLLLAMGEERLSLLLAGVEGAGQEAVHNIRSLAAQLEQHRPPPSPHQPHPSTAPSGGLHETGGRLAEEVHVLLGQLASAEAEVARLQGLYAEVVGRQRGVEMAVSGWEGEEAVRVFERQVAAVRELERVVLRSGSGPEGEGEGEAEVEEALEQYLGSLAHLAIHHEHTLREGHERIRFVQRLIDSNEEKRRALKGPRTEELAAGYRETVEKSRKTLKSREADLARCEEEAEEVRARMEHPLLLTALALMPPSPRVEELMGSIHGSFQKMKNAGTSLDSGDAKEATLSSNLGPTYSSSSNTSRSKRANGGHPAAATKGKVSEVEVPPPPSLPPVSSILASPPKDNPWRLQRQT